MSDYERGYKQGVEDAHRCEQRHAQIDQLEADVRALRDENARLRKALQLIVHGTQDEAPPWRCLGVTQMQAIARDAVQPERGKP